METKGSLEERAREFVSEAGVGDVTKGCADMCECERCVNAIAAAFKEVEREARLAIIGKLCVYCANGLPAYRVEKDYYYPNFGNVCVGEWVHGGIVESNSGTEYCTAQTVWESLREAS